MAIGMLCQSANEVSADFIIFAAEGGTAPQRNVNPTITLPVGATGSIDLWAVLYPGQIVGGLSYDFLADTPGVVSATSHTAVNPPFAPFGNRWSQVNEGTLGQLVDGSIDAVNFVGLAIGLNEVLGASDPTYDATTNSYAVSTINFKANSVGCTDVYLHVGPQAIDGAIGDPVRFGWGDAATTVDMIGSRTSVAEARICAVPEPNAFLLLGSCGGLLIGIRFWRDRKTNSPIVAGS